MSHPQDVVTLANGVRYQIDATRRDIEAAAQHTRIVTLQAHVAVLRCALEAFLAAGHAPIQEPLVSAAHLALTLVAETS